MTPEELRELLASINRARVRGVEVAEIESFLQQGTEFQGIQGVVDALQATIDAGPTGEDAALQRTGTRSPVSNFARSFAQGLTFGFGDEIAGAGAAVGALVPGGRSPGEAFRETTDASRQRLEDLKTIAPGATALSEGAGGVLTGLAPLGLLGKAGQAVKGAGRGIRGVLGGGRAANTGAQAARLGAEGAQQAARVNAATQGAFRPFIESGRAIAGAGAKGSLIGAAEGAVLGLGMGETTEERLELAKNLGTSGALIGGGLGAALRSGLSGFQTLRNRGILRNNANPRIAHQGRELAEGAGSTTSPRAIQELADQQLDVAQQAFKELEQAGPQAAAEVSNFFNRNLSSGQAREVSRRIERIAGEDLVSSVRQKGSTLTFEQVQDIRGGFQDAIDNAFSQGANNEAVRLAGLKRQLDEALISMFDDTTARRAWREGKMVPDAIEMGRRAASLRGEELINAVDSFADFPTPNAGFRAALVDETLNEIGRRHGQTPVRVSADLIEKLNISVGEEAANRIIGTIRREGIAAGRALALDAAIKFASFGLAGSSVAVGIPLAIESGGG